MQDAALSGQAREALAFSVDGQNTAGARRNFRSRTLARRRTPAAGAAGLIFGPAKSAAAAAKAAATATADGLPGGEGLVLPETPAMTSSQSP
jgi:hypothetical protein